MTISLTSNSTRGHAQIYPSPPGQIVTHTHTYTHTHTHMHLLEETLSAGPVFETGQQRMAVALPHQRPALGAALLVLSVSVLVGLSQISTRTHLHLAEGWCSIRVQNK